MKNVQISKKHITGIIYQSSEKTQYHCNYTTQCSRQFSLPTNFAFANWQILLLALLDAIPKKFQRFHFLSSPDQKVASQNLLVPLCLCSDVSSLPLRPATADPEVSKMKCDQYFVVRYLIRNKEKAETKKVDSPLKNCICSYALFCFGYSFLKKKIEITKVFPLMTNFCTHMQPCCEESENTLVHWKKESRNLHKNLQTQ